MLTYQLGQFVFHGMWGGPKFDQTIVECETRPGVNGVSIHDIGRWGQPFDIQTIQFTTTYSAAIEAMKSYSGAAADNAYVMIIGGVTVTGGRYKVISVDATPKSVIVKSPAALSGYLGEVRARWTMLPIADF